MVDVRLVHPEFFVSGVTSWVSPCKAQRIEGPVDWYGLHAAINEHLSDCHDCKNRVAKAFTNNL